MENRFRKILIFILVGLLLGACSKQQSSSEQDQTTGENGSQVVSGACGVSYFPILPDKTWTYRMLQENNLYIENKIWYEEVTDTAFTWKQQMDGDPPITSEARWTCSDEGMISTDFASTNIPMIMQQMGYDYDYQIETMDFSGITFPADDQWFVGSEWTGSWIVESDLTVEDLGLVHAVINVTMNNVIGAEEPVTVLLGSYENAMRVDSTMLLDMSIETQGITLPAIKGEYTMTSWFVQGIGMVKQISNDADFAMELASLE